MTTMTMTMRKADLELVESGLVLDLSLFQQDSNDESRMLVWKDRVGRLNEEVCERLQRLECQTLKLRCHQTSRAVVEMRYSVL